VRDPRSPSGRQRLSGGGAGGEKGLWNSYPLWQRGRAACGSVTPGRGDRRRGGKSASPIRLLPEVSLALPLAVAFLRWELLDTRLGVILASLTMALPVAAWMLSTTFSTIRS
jgi:hypothetical protein